MSRVSRRVRNLTAGAGVLALASLGLSVGPVLSHAGTVPIGAAQLFGYTGAEQTYEVPEGVCEVTIDAAGAQGGNEAFAFDDYVTPGDVEPANGVASGFGGRVQATISVMPGETLSVYVGGKGGDGSAFASGFGVMSVDEVNAAANLDPIATATGGAGGYNGGGAGGAAHDVNSDLEGKFYGLAAASAGGGGGGASDVRQGGNTLADRVVVAGGGGGAGAFGAWSYVDEGGSDSGAGGAGGVGGSGNAGNGTAGADKTPNSGGAGGIAGAAATAVGDAGLGAGGAVVDRLFALVQTSAGGGGGGGLFGGGGGAAGGVTAFNDPAGGGGGGAGTALVPFGAIATDAYRQGDGRVIITPSAPGVGCAPTLQVEKVVSGTSAQPFTVHVVCTVKDITSADVSAASTTEDVTLGYKADGTPDPAKGAEGWSVVDGTWELSDGALNRATCTVTETGTGGAASVAYTCAYTEGVSASAAAPSAFGCPGASSGPAADPAVVVFEGDGDSAVVTITNAFPAVAAEVTPNFTG